MSRKSKLLKTANNPEGRQWPDEIVLDCGSNMPLDCYGVEDNAYGVRYIRHDLITTVKTRSDTSREGQFKAELTAVINRNNIYGDLNLPDFILADYLFSMLLTLKRQRNAEVVWRGKQVKP